MAESWPAQFQDKLLEAEFDFIPGQTKVESQPEFGPVKSRQRFSDPVHKFNCAINIETSLYDDFIAFYYTTLAGGTKTFEFDHPISGLTKEFKMTWNRLPYLGGIYFRVSMTWEQQP